MKKLIYASWNHNLVEPSEEYYNLKRLSQTGILIGRAVGLPRNIDTAFSTTVRPIPDWQHHSPITFAEATDLKAQEIIKVAEGNDLPIVVYWSGGIDSTLILASVVKNFPKALLDRVVIKMTNASYVENPYFFHNVISKYNITYTRKLDNDYHNSMILHGDPADAIWLGGNVLSLNARYPGIYKQNIYTRREEVITILSNSSTANYKADRELAEWIFDYLIENAAKSGFTIETVDDWYWWLIFNFNYESMCIKHIGESIDLPNNDSHIDYLNNFIPWFASDEYQTWSIQAQNTGVKFNGTVRSYKMPAKDYIYELDGNQRYRDYKTKMHSLYLTDAETFKVSAIYNDWSVKLNGNI